MTIELSAREQEVLGLFLMEGVTNRDIGKRIGLSDSTISTYKRRIMRKLKAKNTVELLRIAILKELADFRREKASELYAQEMNLPQL